MGTSLDIGMMGGLRHSNANDSAGVVGVVDTAPVIVPSIGIVVVCVYESEIAIAIAIVFVIVVVVEVGQKGEDLVQNQHNLLNCRNDLLHLPNSRLLPRPHFLPALSSSPLQQL